MAIAYSKRGKLRTDHAEDNAQLGEIVGVVLKEMKARGDSALRNLASKCVGYDRDSYRLSEAPTMVGEVGSRLCLLQGFVGHTEQNNLLARCFDGINVPFGDGAPCRDPAE